MNKRQFRQYIQRLKLDLKSRGYSDMEIRETELIERIERKKRRLLRDIEPYIKELTDISACKPRPPVVLPDGRVMQYVGPMPIWTPNGLDMSEYNKRDKNHD